MLGDDVVVGGEPVGDLLELAALHLPDLDEPTALVVLRGDLEWWHQATQRGLSPADIVATLTVLTAHSIEHAYRTFLPTFPVEVIVSGGGARNPVLMERLIDRLAPARVTTSEEYGLSIEAKEAVAFAVLAYETWHKRPGNLPAATGASHAVVLGNITY